jgi:hypothetical protein
MEPLATYTSVSLSKVIFFGVMAIFGALAHGLLSWRNGQTKSFLDFLALCFISGFAGTMWTLVALNYSPENIYVIGFASGMGGYASIEGLVVIVNFVKSKLNK